MEYLQEVSVKMNSYEDAMIIALDYCGTCAGSCSGCLLTKEERQRKTSFLSHEQYEEIFLKIKKTSVPKKNLVLAFGRGNHLVLSDKDLDSAQEIAKKAQEIFEPETMLVEMSTSLLGKINNQCQRAMNLLEKWGNIGLNLRFSVVGNAELFSNSYWRNIELFFSTMSEYRGGDNDSGDILVLNLNFENLPEYGFLIDKIKKYKFPVNIYMKPYEKEHKESFILKNNEWILNFVQEIINNNLDSNIVNFATSVLNSGNSDKYVFLKNGIDGFVVVTPSGEVNKGYFSIFGEIDFHRISNKNQYWNQNNMANFDLKSLEFKQFKKHSLCKSCNHFSVCFKSGAGFYVSNMEDTKNICPTGLNKVFDLIENRHV